MLAFLPHLLRHCDNTIGTVLHIGAGVGRELEVYQAMQFRQVVAVEADPTLFDKLSRKSKSYNHVLAKNAWIGAQSGETPFHCFANPRFNSLLAPDQLVAHFSNLKQSEQKTAKAVGVNELIAELGSLDSEQSHALILDVQGAEALLLEACSQDSLARFDWVVVRTSQEPLYKDSVTANELAKTLATRDLTLRFSDDENAPFIEHYYQRDQSAITIRQTESKLQESQQRNTQINVRCEELEKAHEQAKKDVADLAVKLKEQSGLIAIKDQALKEKTEQAEQFEQKVAQLTNTLQHQIIDCEQASQNLTAKQARLDKAQQQVDYLSKQLEEKTKQAEEAIKQLQEQKQALVDQLEAQKQAAIESTKSEEFKVDELKSDLAATKKQLEQQTQWHHQNKDKVESLNKQCAELKVLIAERQQSADLAMKLQTKAQIDLEDLRDKYQHKHINEQKLVALISELRAKLQQAAEYYYELQEIHPELNEVSQNQVECTQIEEFPTDNVAELEKKTRPAKGKKLRKQVKSVTRGKL